MSAGWSVDEADGMLYGQVLLRHLEPFTEEEYEDLLTEISWPLPGDFFFLGSWNLEI